MALSPLTSCSIDEVVSAGAGMTQYALNMYVVRNREGVKRVVHKGEGLDSTPSFWKELTSASCWDESDFADS